MPSRSITRRTALSVLIGGSLTSACGAAAAGSPAAVPATPTTTEASLSAVSTSPGGTPTPSVPTPDPTPPPTPAPAPAAVGIPVALPYGPDPSQFGELTMPATPGTTLVVLIHGGFWFDVYDLDLGRPLAMDLSARGYPVWNLEYRRIGNGGGYPETFQDVAAGIDFLAGVPGLAFERLVVIGHSAGGQLGVWAAGRHTLPVDAPGANPTVAVSAVISEAGVLDLARAAEEGVGGEAVPGLMGGYPADYPERYAVADPIQRLPIGVPVRCVHGRDDGIVPIDQSESYVAAAVAAGDDATLIEVPGDHFALITVETPTWATVVDILAQLSV